MENYKSPSSDDEIGEQILGAIERIVGKILRQNNQEQHLYFAIVLADKISGKIAAITSSCRDGRAASVLFQKAAAVTGIEFPDDVKKAISTIQ